MSKPIWTNLLIASLWGCSPTTLPDDPNAEAEVVDPTGLDAAPDGPPLEAASAPVMGGAVLVLEDQQYAAVTDAGTDQVVLLDLSTNDVVATHRFGDHVQPNQLAQGSDGLLWVSQRRSGLVTALAPLTLEPLSEQWVCPAPRGLAAGTNGSMWVACASGELVQLDLHTMVRNIHIAPDLRDVVVDRDGDLWVSQFRSSRVFRVAPTGALLGQRTPPSATYEQLLNGVNRPAVDVRFDPRVAWRMVAHPDGGVVVVHQRASATNISLAPSDNEREPPPYYGPPEPNPQERTTCAAIIHTALTHITEDGPPRTTGVIDRAAVPTDAVVLENGHVRLALAGAAQGTIAPSSVIEIEGVSNWFESDPCYQPTHRDLPGNAMVHSVAVTVDGRQITAAGPPFQIRIGDNVVYEDGAQADDAAGSAMFHRNARFGVACASCHPEGTDDGYAWTFEGIGTRRTQSLLGGVLDTAPFHWDGEFSNMESLLNEVFVARMGGAAPSSSQVRSLTDWIEALDNIATSPMGSGAQIEEGAALFEASGCAECHRGPAFTDNVSYDVGTGQAFQVPSLRGVSLRLPIMHDGCARTLHERFDPECGGTDHGDVESLTDTEVDALVAYLETL